MRSGQRRPPSARRRRAGYDRSLPGEPDAESPFPGAHYEARGRGRVEARRERGRTARKRARESHGITLVLTWRRVEGLARDRLRVPREPIVQGLDGEDGAEENRR